MIEKSKFYYYSFSVLFWIIATWGFVLQEVVPGLTPLLSTFRLLIDAAVIILGLMVLRDRRDIIVIAAFLLISFTSTVVINHESFVTYINGFREYVGLMFIAPIVRYLITNYRREEYIRSINRQLLVFLLLQMVAIPFQAVKYGVGDHGGGTLGDGLSGAISTIIYIGTFYFISQKWDPDNYFRSLRENWKYLLLLIPSFLNETKISFIYLFFFFLLLLGLKWKSVVRLIVALPVLSVLLGVAGYVYLNSTGQDMELLSDPEFYQAYLFGEDADHLLELGENYQEGDYYELEDQWAIDMPRFFKIFRIHILLEDSKGGMIFGAGLGQFKGGTNMDKTDFARRNDYMLRGTIPLTYDLLVQMGILGLIWFLWNIFSLLRFKSRRTPMSVPIKSYLLMIVLLQLCYGTLLTNLMVDIVFFFVAMRTCVMNPEEEGEPASSTDPETVNRYA